MRHKESLALHSPDLSTVVSLQEHLFFQHRAAGSDSISFERENVKTNLFRFSPSYYKT